MRIVLAFVALLVVFAAPARAQSQADTDAISRVVMAETDRFFARDYAAFVTFDKYLGDRKTAKPIREIRVVERVGPEWKIVCVAAFMDHIKTGPTQD